MLVATVLLVIAAALPPQFQAKVQEGAAALDKNDLARARAAFEQATRIAPNEAGGWLMLAQTCARQKANADALAAARKAETLGAKNPQILQGLANFYATLVPDLPKAAAMGQRYAELSPRDVTAWRRLAEFCLNAGLVDQAVAAGTRALAVDNSAATHTVLGSAYLARKDFSRGVAELALALKANPYDEGAHFRLSQAHLMAQDFAGAVEVLLNARRTFDKSPQIELALGVAYYGQRKFPEAIAQFLRTMDLAPDVPQPYLFLGRMMDHLTDRLPEMIDRFTRFQTRNPKSPIGYLLHAKAIVQSLPANGYPPEAAAAFELTQKALALEDKDAEAHYLMGVLLDRQQRYGDAAAQLERSVQLNPKDSAVHFRLARVYDRLGRKDDAVRERELHEKLSEEERAKPR
ncbi:MAG: tetratricopeptide repeat protein [Acidobacteria bacterium]|nr:tetratricopeptide repeat protein [Acidobacteriota bacterium]